MYASEFPEERQQLLEVVGPLLQSTFDGMGIEVIFFSVLSRKSKSFFFKKKIDAYKSKIY